MTNTLKNALVGAMAVLLCAGASVVAQKLTPAEVAAKFTGTWKLNRELSTPSLGAAPARGEGRRGGSPAFAVGFFQRGGGGGRAGGFGGGSSSAALAPMMQVADTLSIKASADSVTFTDPRGERTYAVTDKAVKVEMGTETVTIKSKWDKLALKQDFVSGETKVSHTYELNDAGTRITLKLLRQSIESSDRPGGGLTEIKAVYDKQ